MRGILESVGIILNSAAVITISAALCKMVKNVRKIESEMKEDVFKIVCRVDKIDIETQRKIHNLSEEVKQIRIKSYEDRKPIQDALFTDSILITFSGGTEIKSRQLDYISEVAIKAIASELSEERRTPEIIEEILYRAKENISKTAIKI